jgi:uncharacterized protein YebE (UPF0316 family)
VEAVKVGAMTIFESDMFTFVFIPLLIFCARVCDVTLGTIRIIFVSRGRKLLAPFVAFFEIMIWLVAIGKIFQNLGNIYCYVGYAGGFAAGNFVGIWLEEKLAMGTLIIQVVTKRDASALIGSLRAAGYGVTVVPAEGSTGRVHIIYTLIKRGDIRDVVAIIKRFDPKAFYSVEDVKFASEPILPLRRASYKENMLSLLRLRRKGK